MSGTTVKAFGSACTPLANEGTDLDLAIDFGEAPPSVHDLAFRQFSIEKLKPVQTALFNQLDPGINNKLIQSARIPILRCKKTPIPCEISVWTPDDAKRAYLLNRVCDTA